MRKTKLFWELFSYTAVSWLLFVFSVLFFKENADIMPSYIILAATVYETGTIR